MKSMLIAGLSLVCALATASAGTPEALELGRANHAFDHLGNFGDQSKTATESGANILYVTGLGGLGYSGLPAAEELRRQTESTRDYLQAARKQGMKLAIGYVCATSIVNLKGFDRHWLAELRAKFHTPPSQWRQQNTRGEVLPSWYGGDYEPACMNHPDWREYEKHIITRQLEAGCDGIFFDNPTVHPQGCYCEHCLRAFASFLKGDRNRGGDRVTTDSVQALRELALADTNAFLRFRGTIARGFFHEMREHARRTKRGALLTANNSLNSADVMYSQCRNYAYNILEMSQAEDFVVVEDMSSQPRILPGGKVIEYGPTYRQLQAICHGRPLVAVTLADADYHTPPGLVRLAMAEAIAHGASYLSWPTWPEEQRARMISGIRPQSDFLRDAARYFQHAKPRADVLLFLPFNEWLETTTCKVSALAAELTRANVQYDVIAEPGLALMADNPKRLLKMGCSVVLAAERADLRRPEAGVLGQGARQGVPCISADEPGWMERVQRAIPKRSLTLNGPETVRVVIRDQPGRTLAHLLNMNVQKVTSFTDKVVPAKDIALEVRVPGSRVRSVRALTADERATCGKLEFTTVRDDKDTVVQTRISHLEISTLVVIE